MSCKDGQTILQESCHTEVIMFSIYPWTVLFLRMNETKHSTFWLIDYLMLQTY